MKIVYVEWIDASGTEKYHENVAIPKDAEIGLITACSIGIVVKDTGEYISLAQTLPDSGWYKEIISIPRVNIKLEKVLSDDK